jgi:hypothetical protein
VDRVGSFQKATHFPSGENLISRTGFLKLKWCKTVDRLKLTRIARPSACVHRLVVMVSCIRKAPGGEAGVRTFVDRDQDCCIGREGDPSNVLAVLECERS